MIVLRNALAALLALTAPAAGAQQAADETYAPKSAAPTFAGDGPRVAVDGGHRNFHQLGGRFAPFGRLLAADGYRVAVIDQPFSPAALGSVDLLVVSNARTSADAPAFAATEVAAIKTWVEQGGALFLIADHAPFGDAAAPLAAAFGVEMGAGFAAAMQDGKISANILFSGTLLGTHPILSGRTARDRVKKVQSFTGQSLSVPAGAVALLTLPANSLEVADAADLKRLRQGQSVPGHRVGGRAQAVALTFGKGRVVIAGEAAMFTAQHMRSGQRVGLASFDNEPFALNVMHWLSRTLD